jgi:hypothetical protein
VRAMQERRWLTAKVAGKQNYCALPHLGMHSSNHVPFLSRPSRPVPPRPAADCATTNASSQSHISVFGLCDGQLDCHKYIWLCSTGYNEFGSRHGNTMPASNPLRIPCSVQRTATVIFLHVNHSLIYLTHLILLTPA